MTESNMNIRLLDDPTNPRRYPVPGLDGEKYATEAVGEAVRQASLNGNVTGVEKHTSTSCKTTIRAHQRIATWNVRGLLGPGKISIVEKEIEKYKLSILGVSETHMRGQGHFRTASGNTLYFSGAEDSSHHGVGFFLPPKLNQHVLGYNPVSDRIITLKLNTRPCTLNIIQVYAPTSQASEDDINDFYRVFETTMNKIPNREITIVLGDWNAKVGNTSADDHIRKYVGKYGLGVRNERGMRLIELCIEKNLTILNTCFQHHPRRLYTWKSPGDRFRNQIDYILIDSRWRSSVSNTKTFPGAECGSDHNLLVADFALRLKAPKKRTQLAKQLKKSERLVFQTLLEDKMKNNPPSQLDANALWEYLKNQMTESIHDISKKRPTIPKKQTWLTEDTWELINKRKRIKMKGLQNSQVLKDYVSICKDIRKNCRKDKNKFIENICSEIEQHCHKFETSDLFKKVRLLSKQFKPKTWGIEDSEGNIINNLDAVAERWRGYCEDLYKNSSALGTSYANCSGVELEPSILRSEIFAALKALKTRKAPGPDQVTAETLTALGDTGIDMLHMICNEIWRNGEWPRDWTLSVVVPLHKKGSTRKCDHYRTLALISHASKILLYILNNRIRHYLDWQIPQEQAGFVKGKGTREQILNVRQLIEKAYEFNMPIIMCFVDYSKAFDCVDWRCLWKILDELGVPQHLVILLRNLYYSSEGVVRVDEITSKPFKFCKGVRQGCVLSPILFNIYGEYIMRRTLDEWEGGISIGGTKLTNLRYADDTTLLAASEIEMTSLLNRMERISEEMGLSINRSKTKAMVIDRCKKLELIGSLNLEIVENFIYLGSNISNNGSCETEIRRRIGMAKSAMSQLHKIWRDKHISMNTKMRLVRTLIFPIFMYATETWTIKAADRHRIDAFEMWCWRRMLRIPWTAHRTNASILKQLKVTKRLSTICLQRILEYFGHIARREGNNLEKIVITGKVDGKRPRGRSPIRWSDQIRTALDSKIHDALHIARNRGAWREIVHKRNLGGRGHDPQ